MNQRGQSLIEALIASMAVIAMIQVLLLVVFCSSLKIFIDYRAHEALVCSAQGSGEHCRQRLRSEIETFLVIGKIQSLRLIKSQQKISVQIDLKFSFLKGNFPWLFRDEISIPFKP